MTHAILSPGHYVFRTFDGEGDSFAVKLTPGVYRFDICTFLNAKHFLVDADGPVILTLEGCTLSNTMHGIRLRGAAVGFVRSSSFSDWLHYAVSIEGTADAGPRVTVDDCEFANPKPGADSKGKAARQCIVANNPTGKTNIFDLRVTNNRCFGPGIPWSKTDNLNGTGDQISLHHCDRFHVLNNTSIGGGENGIAISLGCRHGIVSGNIVSGNDAHGIQIGVDTGSSEPDCTDISLTGNVCTDNGIGRDDPKLLAGIYCQDAHGLTITGNRITDSAGRQAFGLLLAKCQDFDVGRNTLSGTRAGFVPFQIYATETMRIRHDLSGAVVGSVADPIIEVVADDVTLDRLSILGRFKDDGVRQRGIFSETAQRCRVTGCRGSGMTNFLKLDREADEWQISDCFIENIFGVKDGFGYGFLFGFSSGHSLSRCKGIATPNKGRHFVYLSAGTSNCRVTDCHATGFNSSTFAVYATKDQRPCVANAFERCTAKDQLTGHDGSSGGAVDAAAFELTGKVNDTTIRDCSAANIAVNGLVVNTHGLDAQGVTVERFTASGCKLGVFLSGAKRVRILDSTIENGVAIHPWWRTAPKRATEDVEIVRTVAKVVINPTLPRPRRIVQDGKVLAP